MLIFAVNDNVDLGTILTYVGIFAAFIVVLIILAVFARYFRLWSQSVTTGASIGIVDMLGMTFRKVPHEVIVRTNMMVVQAGLVENETGITSRALEAHYLTGGNV